VTPVDEIFAAQDVDPARVVRRVGGENQFERAGLVLQRPRVDEKTSGLRGRGCLRRPEFDDRALAFALDPQRVSLQDRIARFRLRRKHRHAQLDRCDRRRGRRRCRQDGQRQCLGVRVENAQVRKVALMGRAIDRFGDLDRVQPLGRDVQRQLQFEIGVCSRCGRGRTGNQCKRTQGDEKELHASLLAGAPAAGGTGAR
jgi:hypothetical protein